MSTHSSYFSNMACTQQCLYFLRPFLDGMEQMSGSIRDAAITSIWTAYSVPKAVAYHVNDELAVAAKWQVDSNISLGAALWSPSEVTLFLYRMVDIDSRIRVNWHQKKFSPSWKSHAQQDFPQSPWIRNGLSISRESDLKVRRIPITEIPQG